MLTKKLPYVIAGLLIGLFGVGVARAQVSSPSFWQLLGGTRLSTIGNYTVGVNTTTPVGTLSVKGRASTIPVYVASSTGAVLFQIGQNGSTTISSLASQGCVAATASGSLYITSCGSGGGAGTISTSTHAQIGKTAIWTGLATLGNGSLFDNGTVAGANGTSSSFTFYVNGNLGVVGTTTLSAATTTINGLTYYWPTSITGTKILQNDGSGNLSWVADQTGGGGSLSGGVKGYVGVWASSTSMTTGILLDNGTVAGANATSSTVTFNVQGSGVLNPFNVSSSSGTSILHVTSGGNVGVGTTTPAARLVVVGTAGNTSPLIVASSTGATMLTIGANGSTTISSLTAGIVRATSGGSLYSDNGTYPTGSGATSKIAYWNSASNLTSNTNLSYNGSLFAFNTTLDSAVDFKVQGGSGGAASIFSVTSSSGTSLLAVAGNGSTTLSSLGAGPVYSTAGGSLYINGTTGTGLSVRQTSPTLITPILGVASSTSISVSGILWGNGQTNLTTASATALTLSNNLWVTGNTALTGTLNVTGQTTLANASTTNLSIATNAYLTNIASGNCLQTGAGGLITGTGSACGSGGSGNSAWTIGNGVIYNATSTDNVGIGTTSPQKLLHVFGNQTGGIARIERNTGTSTLLNTLYGTYDIRAYTASSTTAVWEGTGATQTFSIATPGGATTLADFGAVMTGNVTSGRLLLRAYGAGTFNTVSSLTLDGYQSTAGFGSTTPWANLVVQSGAGGTLPILTVATSTGASFFQVNPTGNIGISTTTPAYKLTVVGTAGNNPVLNVASSTGVSMLHVGANGKVGIGTSTPQGMLDILDTSSNTQPSILYIGGTTTPSTTKLGCLALYDNSAKLYVYVKFVSGAFTTSTTASICQ